MAIEFREVSLDPLAGLSARAPDGAVIGILGERGAGQTRLLHLAAGLEQPTSGTVAADEPSRLLGPSDSWNLSPVRTLLLDHAFSQMGALARLRAAAGLERLRRQGTAILLVSQEQELLRELCDEIWWLDQGRLAARGEPLEVLERYRRQLTLQIRQWGQDASQPLTPSFRRGDGRARLLGLETLDSQGRPAMVWHSGEPVAVRVRVRFEQPVEDPVVGIMIRTRIGMEVFGTNTGLEGIPLGPCPAGETLAVTFSFLCQLCPQQYTLTAASHDPDGVWHDWMEDALAFSVTDSRYTAGVVNLRAAVAVERGRVGV